MIEVSKIRVKEKICSALSTQQAITSGYNRHPGNRKETNVLQSLWGWHAQIYRFYALSFFICTNDLRH